MTQWLHDPTVLSSHLADESGMSGTADAILFPRTPEELAAAITDATHSNRTITIQGAKTGFVAGAVPDGGAVVNLSRLNAVTAFRYDAANGTGEISVQSGYTRDQLAEALQRKQQPPTAHWDPSSQAAWDRYAASPVTLWFLPNPTETTATIGGMIATAASGARVTPEAFPAHIHAVTAALPSGELRRFEKADAPFPLCGAEGITCVTAEATLLLTPRPPARYGLMTFHERYEQALAFLSSVTNAAAPEADASILSADWFDCSCRDFLTRHAALLPPSTHLPAFPGGTEVALWLELAGTNEGLLSLLTTAMELLENGGGFADAALATTDDRDTDRLGHIRHLVTETCNRLSLGNPSPVLDWTAPADAWPAVATRMATLFREEGVPFILMGHARDGRTSARLPGLSRTTDGARQVVRKAAELLREAGCRPSGEHGYGRLKREWLRELDPEQSETWRRIRQEADPRGLLNPDVVVSV